MFGDFKQQKAKLWEILKKIECGSRVLLEIPKKGTIKATFLGWYPDNFLITSLPPFTGIKRVLEAEPEITLRFLQQGNIYSTQTTPFFFTFKPTGMLFLREPFTLEATSLRKAPRITCFWPATILKEKKEIKGILLDLSRGGAAFLSKDKKTFSLEEEVKLTFKLPTDENPLQLNCLVKRLSEEEDQAKIALVFKPKKDEEKAYIDKIDKYIKNLLIK